MIRLREGKDVAELLEWRKEVIHAVFGMEADDALIHANLEYYEAAIAGGGHIALIADIDGTGAGCGAICFQNELPSPDNPGGRCAYIMNIYVREPYRGKGIATAIVRELISVAKKHNCGKIYLESTREGLPLYSRIGFKPIENMMKL